MGKTKRNLPSSATGVPSDDDAGPGDAARVKAGRARGSVVLATVAEPGALVGRNTVAARTRRVYRARDLLDAMRAAGEIDAGQLAAGRWFQALFHAAGIDPLRAADLGRIPGGAGGEGDRALDARQQVYAVMARLGKKGSPVVTAAWHVIGHGESVKAFARRQVFGPGRHLDEKVAKGLVIGAVCLIEMERDRIAAPEGLTKRGTKR